MKKPIIILLASLLLFSCENSKKESYRSEPASNEEYTPGEGYEVSEQEVTDHQSSAEADESHHKNISDNKSETEQKTIIPEKMIREGNITIQIEDFEKDRAALNEILGKHQAYISHENQTKNDYRISGSITIRVASGYFDPLITELEDLAEIVEYKNISLRDVTEEYVDLQARLKSRKKVEERYYEILKQARTIEDILKVEVKLSRIREEIEAAEGRLKYLDNKVSLSTINLNIYQQLDFTYKPEKTPGFFQKIKKSLNQGWHGLLKFIIFILNLWPIILIVVIIIWFAKRRLKRYNVKKPLDQSS